MSKLPQHLVDLSNTESQPTSLDTVAKYVLPPFVKVIQKSANEEDYGEFNPGDVIVTGSKTLICKKEQEFLFTPVFSFTDFAIWNPFGIGLPMIRERTLDPNSDIAAKARALHKEPCPERPDETIKWIQGFNFAIFVHGVKDLQDVLVTLPFASGEFKYGANAVQLMRSRRFPNDRPAEMHACNYRAISTIHRNPANTWWGLNIVNPSPDKLWVNDEGEFQRNLKAAKDNEEGYQRLLEACQRQGSAALIEQNKEVETTM